MSSPGTANAAVRDGYSQLLSLAVHELRTPAGVVGGYLRLLLREGGEPLTEPQRKMIREAEKACGRIVALIAELSDVSKLDGGLIELAREPLDLFTLIGDLAEHVHEAADREVCLQVRGATEGAPLLGDRARLRAAFEAVFRAILREKIGPCTVIADRRRVTCDGQAAAVLVVAEERDVQTVYDSKPAAFDEKRGGLGLALPLARRVIEGHGGRLWSPAARPGDEDARARGSAVISLPITESTR